jgi:thioredoxin-like negative regulator of GroEL
VYFVKNGQVVDRIIGVNPATVYEQKIAEHSASTEETHKIAA